MTPACTAVPALLGMITGLLIDPGLAQADTDFTTLSDRERVIFHAEIRQALLSVPQLLPQAPVPAINPYADAAAHDLAQIIAHAKLLFDPPLPGFGRQDAGLQIALFTSDTCGQPCDDAESDLRALAETKDIRVSLLSIEQSPGLVAAFEIDTAPFYVFPDKLLRGYIPMVVIQRYVAD